MKRKTSNGKSITDVLFKGGWVAEFHYCSYDMSQQPKICVDLTKRENNKEKYQ